MHNFVNKIFLEDNLSLLKRLPSNCINLIYSDILFGTGRKFKHYKDIKPKKDGIYNFYIPRIKEMHRVLKDTGSIYLQMDWRIVHWLRCIMDDIFGYKNFRNEIIWHYDLGNKPKNAFKRKHDNILFYSKTNNNTFNEIRIPARNEDRYYLVDEKGKHFTDTAGRKCYLADGIICEDVWSFLEDGNLRTLNAKALERNGYDNQKSLYLMNRIIKASSNEGDIVADFFCGSGSFLVSAQNLGRKYIGCDNNSEAVKIANQRIKKTLPD